MDERLVNQAKRREMLSDAANKANSVLGSIRRTFKFQNKETEFRKHSILMDWNYSNPLSEALLASRTNQANLFHKPYFSSYDPLITKYPNRPSYINRSSLYDDIDELALQVETENLLTSRYRPINQLNNQYVPSYFNKNNQTSLEENNFSNELFDDRLDENINAAPVKNPAVKPNKIPQQPPKFGKKNDSTQSQKNSPNKNTNNSPQNRNKTRESDSDLVAGQVPVQAHNSQEQRFLQYQQRMAQQQHNYAVNQPQFQQNENSLSELELLKLKQQQDRQQLLAGLGQKQVQSQNQFQLQQQTPSYSNQNIYAPFFQPNYFKTQKQYSEASIQSTNADPLNSNNPTPPLFAQRDHVKKNQYKQSDDDPGSYLNTLKETRLREQRLAKDKYTTHDYKKYQKNFGFGRDFLPFENETKEEKMEKAKKRGEYAKLVKERNSDKYTYNDNAAFIRRTQNKKLELDISGGNKRQNRK